ncbi:hypothetical protein O181_046210 [Austropuccinia psidii MF-1]|uniref:Uncharacterized protein n=1 Tax=Austropuccinia psidii MF-1 TaxID=1389203 RepID=A0A9Q3DSW8_9BASI|nr:hypothetical protein [Austropuccinia psidii MF-1]
MALLGHLGPYGLYSPQSVGKLRPFWPNSNEAKRGQVGVVQQLQSKGAPKPQVGPPEPVVNPKLAINQSMASGNNQRPPDQLQARIPLQFRGRVTLLQCTMYSRTRSGAYMV